MTVFGTDWAKWPTPASVGDKDITLTKILGSESFGRWLISLALALVIVLEIELVLVIVLVIVLEIALVLRS